MNQNSDPGMPLTTFLSDKEKVELARSLDESQREYLGEDRFEAYGARFTPPAWMAGIPRLPERDENGRLPTYIPQ